MLYIHTHVHVITVLHNCILVFCNHMYQLQQATVMLQNVIIIVGNSVIIVCVTGYVSIIEGTIQRISKQIPQLLVWSPSNLLLKTAIQQGMGLIDHVVIILILKLCVWPAWCQNLMLHQRQSHYGACNLSIENELKYS